MMMYNYVMVGPFSDDRELMSNTLEEMNKLKELECPIVNVVTSKTGHLSFIFYQESEKCLNPDLDL